MDPAMVVPLCRRETTNAYDFTRGTIGNRGAEGGPDPSNQKECDRPDGDLGLGYHCDAERSPLGYADADGPIYATGS